ncbi:MAG TPA: tripartite tricarboxylate transporter substrate binding protein [Burkholderiales bacterium]|nr:tripartite tricarboxylate transporter substrate binding protein [Burkholderiales bacterium]
MKRTLAVALLLACVSAHAQSYPVKPMRWVVPFAPGGGTDMVARPIAQRFSERVGQPVTYDNRGGGGGVIAGEIVARAAPDGYTLLVAAVAVMTVNSTLMKMPFDPLRDFVPITKFAASPNMLAARPGLPAKTVQALIDYAKANPKKLTWAVSGIGSAGHLAMELFAQNAKIEVVRVVYKGAGPAMLALLTNESDVLFANPSVFLPHIRNGRLRSVAVASTRRISALPDTPTVIESGFPGFESGSWYGLAAPAKTSPAIVTFLHKQVSAVLAQPDLVALLAADGSYPVLHTPQDFARELREETAKWAKVIRDANIRLQAGG